MIIKKYRINNGNKCEDSLDMPPYNYRLFNIIFGKRFVVYNDC